MDTADTKEFEHRKKLLDSLNIKYGLADEFRGEGKNRKTHNLRVFTSIFLPFTPHEWSGLTQRGGQFYVGGCCGAMSAVQDMLCGIHRDGGWMNCTDIEQLAKAMSGHDEAEHYGLRFDKLKAGQTLDAVVEEFISDHKKHETARKQGEIVIDPFYWLALIWHIIKDFYVPAKPMTTSHNTSVFDLAMGQLVASLNWLRFDKLFDKPSNVPSTPVETVQHDATRLNQLARVIAPLRMLTKEINDLKLAPIEGFAIVEKSSPDSITSNGNGYCILPTQEDVDKLFKLWKQSEEEYKTDYERRGRDHYKTLAVRKVRVSLEEGIEFLS